MDASVAAWHWWIDAVGGYLTLAQPTVRIGRVDSDADIAILGDLAENHAELERGDFATLLRPLAEMERNGERLAPGQVRRLEHGDLLRMKSVEVEYRRPIIWSSTSVLRLRSRHRLPLALDGVILLGETCVVGPRTEAHVRANWPGEEEAADTMLRVSRSSTDYWLRTDGPLTIDGKQYDAGGGPLRPPATVEGPWGSFQWEPIGA